MRTAICSVKLLKTVLFVLLIFSLQYCRCQAVLLPQAFAHNDYFHERPLLDALDNGYTNIEADVFLQSGNLVVAHINPFFKSSRTLENLYLKPLAKRIAQNGGTVFAGSDEGITLMIDIKTDAYDTYGSLKKILEKYRNILTSYDNGIISKGPVMIVLSGNKPYGMIKAERHRFAFIDQDLTEAVRDTAVHNVYALASCKYSKLLRWTGKGNIPAGEQKRLVAYVTVAHRYGRRVRLWASPENDAVWQQLLRCGVDLINTDKLVELRNFLVKYKSGADITTPLLTADKLANEQSISYAK